VDGKGRGRRPVGACAAPKERNEVKDKAVRGKSVYTASDKKGKPEHLFVLKGGKEEKVQWLSKGGGNCTDWRSCRKKSWVKRNARREKIKEIDRNPRGSEGKNHVFHNLKKKKKRNQKRGERKTVRSFDEEERREIPRRKR